MTEEYEWFNEHICLRRLFPREFSIYVKGDECPIIQVWEDGTICVGKDTEIGGPPEVFKEMLQYLEG